MSDEKKAYFSPLPKMSMGNKKRKSINYLQQCKEEGKKDCTALSQHAFPSFFHGRQHG